MAIKKNKSMILNPDLNIKLWSNNTLIVKKIPFKIHFQCIEISGRRILLDISKKTGCSNVKIECSLGLFVNA